MWLKASACFEFHTSVQQPFILMFATLGSGEQQWISRERLCYCRRAYQRLNLNGFPWKLVPKRFGCANRRLFVTHVGPMLKRQIIQI